MDWIYLPQNMDQWQALVKLLLNLYIRQNAAKSLTSRRTVSSSIRTLLRGIRLYKPSMCPKSGFGKYVSK